MGNKRALVVDDSKVGRLTMKKRLEAIGAVVDLVESGEEALDYLAQSRPDMIFMDHMMPGEDGFVVTQKIRANPATQDIPVIIISGNDDEDFVQQARAIGAVNAIRKPPEVGVLEGILRSLPEAVAGAAPAAARAAAPQPVAVERRATPYMDQAAVHAVVERVLGEVIEHLHSDLLAELGTQVAAELDKEREAQREWGERLRAQMEQTTAAVADLHRYAEEAETLKQQLEAMEQRLVPLESEAGRAAPDLGDVLDTVEQRITSQLAELQASAAAREPALEALRQELLARADDQQAQAEQSAGELASRLEGLAAEMKRLSEGSLSAAAGQDQRLGTIEARLVAMENAEPTPGPDTETVLAALDERISPRLAEMRSELLARLEERPSMPPEEALIESLSGRLQAQHVALRSELDALRGQVQDMARMKDDLEVGLADLGQQLQVKIDEAQAGLQACFEQERSQLSAGVEAQQSRLAASDEDWAHRLQTLEERLGEMAQADTDEIVQRVLEQRIARMREVISEALQPAYPGLMAAGGSPSSPRGPLADEGGSLLKEIEAEVNDLRERISESHLHHLVADAVSSARLPTETEHDVEERVAQRLSDRWNDRLRAEVARLEGRVKTLTVMLAVGGGALLAAIALVALLR